MATPTESCSSIRPQGTCKGSSAPVVLCVQSVAACLAVTQSRLDVGMATLQPRDLLVERGYLAAQLGALRKLPLHGRVQSRSLGVLRPDDPGQPPQLRLHRRHLPTSHSHRPPVYHML